MNTFLIRRFPFCLFVGVFLAFFQCPLVQGLSTISKPSSSKISYTQLSIDTGKPATVLSSDSTLVVGEQIKNGESMVLVSNIVTKEECQWLEQACIEFSKQTTRTTELDKPGLMRIPTIEAHQRAMATKTPCADPLPHEIDVVLQSILDRVMKYIDHNLPSISQTLFQTDSMVNLKGNNQLKFSSREPAINIYTPGGEFLAHKDAQALTVLLPLSDPSSFQGGGTAFWSQDARGHRVEDPSLVVKPEAGTTLLFGGCVTHAGVAVDEGCRVVLVASFSRQSDSKGSAMAMDQPQRDIYGDSM